MISDNDRAELLDAACEIIDSSVDAKSLFDEACSLAKKLKIEKSKNEEGKRPVLGMDISVGRFLEVTCQTCTSSFGHGKDALMTPSIATHILKLSQSINPEEGQLLDKTSRRQLHDCVGIMKAFFKQKHWNKDLFMSIVIKNDLPLEVLWSLYKAEALELDVYITRKLKREERFKDKLRESLVTLCQGPIESQPLRQEMMSGFIGYLLQRGFCEKKTTEVQPFRGILESLLKDLLDIEPLPTEEESLALPSQFLSMSDTIGAEIMKKFTTHSLSLILTHKATESVQEYMMSKAGEKLDNVSCIIRQMIFQFLLPLTYHEALGTLTRSLEHQHINCDHLRVYLSVLFISFPEAASGIADYILSMVVSATESGDSSELFLPFFLARLSSSLGQHCFPCYSSWYQATFSGPSSVTLNRAGFIFLIKFLTSLVPYDSAEHLKTHIFKTPTPPQKCKNCFEEFVILAKTRLADLWVPLHAQLEGMFDDNNSGTGQREKRALVDSVQRDVEKVLTSYAESRKIPAVLLEASIFRRPYFIGKFLPALLTPRVLPDQPDDRMLLIEEVNRAGKIPGPLYNRYLQDCEKEKQMLLEGVFDLDDDDDEMQELSLPLLEQLGRRLTKYVTAVLSQSSDTDKACLSAIVEKVSTALADSPSPHSAPLNQSMEAPITVDLDHWSSSTGTSSKICRMLLEQMSHLVTQWSQNKAEEPGGEHKRRPRASSLRLYKCVEQLIHLLSQQFARLRLDLCSCVLVTLNKQSLKDANEIAPGLPLMCLSLATLPQRLSINLAGLSNVEAQNCSKISFIKALLLCLDIVNGKDDVLCFYIQYVEAAYSLLESYKEQLHREDVVELRATEVDVTTEEHLLPETLVKKVLLICQRLGVVEGSPCHTTEYDSSSCTPLRALFDPEIWTPLHEKYQLLLPEWVEMELLIDITGDHLSGSDRWLYLWKTACWYLSQGWSLPGLCKSVIHTLAQHCDCIARTRPEVASNLTSKTHCFLKLLQKLCLKLPPRGGGKSTWLYDVMQSLECVRFLIRFALELPAHLLLCDSPQEKIGEENTSCAVIFIESLTRSSENKGAYLSLDATTYVIQAVESIMSTQHSLPASTLNPVILHPIVFISLLVHKPVLDIVNFSEISRPSSPWHEQISELTDWLHHSGEPSTASFYQKKLLNTKDWQKAAALFSCAIQRKLIHTPEKWNLNQSIQGHVMELLVMHLTIAGSWSDSERVKEGSLAKVFAEMLAGNPGVLTQLLSTEQQQPEIWKFRRQLGLDAQPWMNHLRDLIVLRLASTVPAAVLLQSTNECGNITASVVSAYWRVLTHAEEGETHKFERFQTHLSHWIRSLVDLTSCDHLASIPNFQPTRVHSDILLFRYIQEKKTQF